MPHQRGEHPSFGASRGGPPRDHPHLSTMQHVIDFQRRSVMGPRMIHHSPGSHHGMMQGPVGMFRGAHPHSPASWSYASSHASSPHRVPGGLSATSSGENLMEEQVANHRDCSEEERGYGQSGYDASPAMREKADIISEAIKRHLDDDRSIGTNEADAASALLFATTVVRHTESSKVSVAGEQHQSETEKVEAADEGQRDGDKPDKSSNPGTTEKEEVEMHESNVPLKKRRKLLNFVRKPNTTLEGQKNPLHVSPLPSPAGHSQGQDHGSSEETVATTSPQRTTTSSSTCFTSSYDTRGAQTLHDGSKIGDAVEITPPPSQVVIEFFPLLLHNVLSKSEFADNVLQWVSDGKAWKIVRWDALRRKVLPKYFSKLQDEDGNVGSSIDAFLYNVTSWGFEEVQEGPDVGAYAHDVSFFVLLPLSFHSRTSKKSQLISASLLLRHYSSSKRIPQSCAAR